MDSGYLLHLTKEIGNFMIEFSLKTKKNTNVAPEGYNLIKPGTFIMGSPENERGRYSDEVQHQVTITRPFYMKITPVTQVEWHAVMGNNPSGFHYHGDNSPVEHISWYDAIEYCNALSRKQGLEECYELSGCNGIIGKDFECLSVIFKGLSCNGYRLPTEAEWEYAARAGSNTALYRSPENDGTISQTECDSIDPNLDKIAWYCGNTSRTHPVGSKAPNAFELYDMLGNVYEWCNDWYGMYPTNATDDPIGPESGDNKVVRGGCWNSCAQFCRTTLRNWGKPNLRNNYVGFRPVRTCI